MFSFHNTNLNLSNQVRRSLSFSLHNSTTVEAACKFESMSYWSRMLELSMVFVKWRGFLYVVNSCCLKCNQLQDFFLLIFQTSLNIDVYVWAPGFSPKKWRFKNIFSIKIIISKFQFSNKNIQTQKKKNLVNTRTHQLTHRPRNLAIVLVIHVHATQTLVGRIDPTIRRGDTDSVTVGRLSGRKFTFNL